MSTLAEQIEAVERRAEEMDRSARVWACIRMAEGQAESCRYEARVLRDAAATIRRQMAPPPRAYVPGMQLAGDRLRQRLGAGVETEAELD